MNMGAPEGRLFYPSVFDRDLLPLLASLRGVEPRFGYHILSAIHAREEEILREGPDGTRRQRLTKRYENASPDPSRSPEELADAYCRFRGFADLVKVFATLYTGLLGDLVRVDGAADPRELLARGEKVVLVPFHVHHFQPILGVLSDAGLPLTVLGGDYAALAAEPDSDEVSHWTLIRDALGIDLDILQVTDPRVLFRSRAALRQGRALIWYGDRVHETLSAEVIFLGHAMKLSVVLPRFLRREGAVSVPLHARAERDDPTIVLTYGDAIPAPASEADDRAYLQYLCDFYKASLRKTPCRRRVGRGMTGRLSSHRP
jgi:hypothetical protein